MKFKNLFSFLLIFTISVSCSEDINETVKPNYGSLNSEKTSTVPDEYEDGWIRVKFRQLSSDNAIAEISGDNIETGILELDDLAAKIGATKIERVFAEGGRYKERRRAAGLHLWYDFYVGEDDSESDDSEKKSITRIIAKTAEPDYVEIVELIPIFRQSSTTESMERLNHTFKAISSLNSHLSSPLRATSNFNDPLLSLQWHYQNNGPTAAHEKARKGADINLFSAWEITTGHPKVIVAVMDGGVDYAHPDLAQNMWINTAEKNGVAGVDDDDNGYIDDVYGYRWSSSSTPPAGGDIKPMDHGTHCAGTIAAVNNNSVGIGGVAGGNGNSNSGVRIMSCQTFVPDPEKPEDPYGNSKSTSKSADAFAYAADNGAVIVNCSFSYSGTTLSAAYKAGIDYFVDNAGKYPGSPMKGGLVVAAAGNDGQEISKYPASYERCVSVAYMTSDFVKSSSSNFGTWINITAPGGATSSSYAPDKAGGVLSTVPMASGNYDVQQGYGYKSGTSMAAPHVAGVAALIVSAIVEKGITDYTVDQLWDALMKGTRNIDQYNTQHAGKLGVGYSDARLALDFALGNEVEVPGVEIASTITDIDNINLRWRVPAGLQGQAPESFYVFYGEISLEGLDYVNPSQGVISTKIENSKNVNEFHTLKFEDLKSATKYNIGIVAVYKDNLKSAPLFLSASTDSPDGGVVSFTLTPNPVKDNLYIYASSNPVSPVRIKIFNAIGNKVLEKNITLTTQMPASVDMSKLSSGVYTVVIIYEGVEHKFNIAKN